LDSFRIAAIREYVINLHFAKNHIAICIRIFKLKNFTFKIPLNFFLNASMRPSDAVSKSFRIYKKDFNIEIICEVEKEFFST